jgi:hypothetical protein
MVTPYFYQQRFLSDSLSDILYRCAAIMTRGFSRTCRPVVLAGIILACASSTEPFDTIPSSVIRSELSIAPVEVVLGSSITLEVATTNHGNGRISASSGCAPGLGFRIKRPDGVIVDPYAGLAFICPRLDSQDLEPGETDTITWQWAPPVPGRYEVIGGLLVKGRIMGPSGSKSFQVR